MSFQKKIKLHFKLPTIYNDKKPIPPKEFIEVKNDIIKKFKGLSITPGTEGFWTAESGDVIYDETIEYVIFIEKEKFHKEVELELQEYLEAFKARFKQFEIFCYYHEVMST